MNFTGPPAPDLSKKTIDELIQELSVGQVGSPHHAQASLVLQVRLLEQQSKVNESQAKATEAQAKVTEKSTGQLVFATWALVAAVVIQCLIMLLRHT